MRARVADDQRLDVHDAGTRAAFEPSGNEFQEDPMIAMHGLFEAHLPVRDLQRAMDFYGNVLRLELAHHATDREAAFYWLGAPGHSMLGLWAAGDGPQRVSLHVAFRTTLADVLEAPRRLRAAGIEPRGFDRRPVEEPQVLGWMPAAAVYFEDPDGHLLEAISMLHHAPRPDLGIVPWSQWEASADAGAAVAHPRRWSRG